MTRTKRRIIIAIALIVCAAVAATAWNRRGDFTLLATHRDATTQPTATGRVIAALMAFDHQRDAGYGDYGSNTGPIVIRAFDPAAGRFGEPLLTSQTEAIYTFRWIADRLYAPHIDPAGERTAGTSGIGSSPLYS